MGKLRILILLIISFTNFKSFAQPSDSKQDNTINNKVLANQELLSTNPEKAFAQIPELLKEAAKLNDEESELLLLANKCRYFHQKMEIDKLLEASEELISKAENYGNPRFEAIGIKYLMNIYLHNGLLDKAEKEYKSALGILESLDENSPEIINTKAGLHTGISNAYLKNKDFEKAINYLLLSYKEYNKLQDNQLRQKALYWTFSNLASAYVEVNTDSAEFYVNNSILIQPPTDSPDKFSYKNHTVLGKIYQDRFEFDKAIREYKLSEEIGDEINLNINKEFLYNRLIECYKATKDSIQEKVYSDKLKDIQLQTVENENKSLHKIISSKPEESNENSSNLIIILGGIALATAVIIFFVSKNRHQNQNKVEPEIYNSLLALAKENDPGFMFAFEKIYPDFSEKLLKINSDLTQYEIEFSALLKLNLSSKEIAKIKSIETRTVQNRKSNLRKKLNISEDQETNMWFSKL